MNRQSEEDIFVTKPFLPPFEEYLGEIKKLWHSSRITNMGEFHKKLEENLKRYLNVSQISLFTNGHMALELLIQAMGLSGEVITTPFTFVSTAHAIKRNNLTPVFCDINEKDYTIDVDKIEDLITDKTSAIIPVHVYGHVCDDNAIEKIAKKYNLKVIYDAAHAFGVKQDGKSVVSYGDASILSFHATKVFNTIEGGAVIYSDEKLGKKLYGLKNFGIRNEIVVDDIGANAKMDEFRAAMGLCNLHYIDYCIKKREIVYQRYLNNLEGIEGVILSTIPKNIEYNFSYFPIVFDEKIFGKKIRDHLYDYLKSEHIYTRRYFYPLITEMECYKKSYNSGKTPIAKKISENILTLPLYPDLDLDTVDEICELISGYLHERI